MRALTSVLLLAALCGCTSSNTSNQEAQVTLPAQTAFVVSLQKDLDSTKLKVGDHFTANLEQAVVQNGQTVVPAGTKFQGRVTNEQNAQPGKGGVLSLTLDSFSLGVSNYPIKTGSQSFESSGLKPDANAPGPSKQVDEARKSTLVTKDTTMSFTLDEPLSIKPAGGNVGKQY